MPVDLVPAGTASRERERVERVVDARRVQRAEARRRRRIIELREVEPARGSLLGRRLDVLGLRATGRTGFLLCEEGIAFGLLARLLGLFRGLGFPVTPAELAYAFGANGARRRK